MTSALLILFLIFVPVLGFSQSDMTKPSEEELLDFDAIDKGEEPKSAPPPTAEAPPPAAPPTAPPAAANEPPPPAVAKPQQQDPPVVDPLEPTLEPPPPEAIESTETVPPPAPPPADDTPALAASDASSDDSGLSSSDKKREARMARIYQKFDSSETSDEEWSKIAAGKAAESYAIQQGDTLWDLSANFFGNGFYWPKIWQLNDSITNPHMIQVGNTLNFSPGSSTAPPKLDVEQSGASVEVTDAGSAEGAAQDSGQDTAAADEEEIPPEKEGEDTSKILIPPPLKRRPVVNKLPPSFPDFAQETETFDEQGFTKEVVMKFKPLDYISLVPSIIVDEAWTPAGEVVETDGNAKIASTYQTIILQLESPAQKGDIFTVFSDNGKVSDPISGDGVGYEIQTRAEIEILEQIEGTDDNFRAVVKTTSLPVRVGDYVKLGKEIIRAKFNVDGATNTTSARIVDGENGARKVLGLHNVVFLNRGDQDGIQVGGILNVIKNVQLRNEDSVVKFDPRPIGLLKVVHVGQHVSTAVIVAERDGIVPGDETSIVAANTLNSIDSKGFDQGINTGSVKGPKRGQSEPEEAPAPVEEEIQE